MSRATLAVLLAAMLAAPALAAASPAGEGDVQVDLEGRPVAVEHHQGGAAPGDDSVVVRQGLERVGVTWRGAPLGTSAEVGVAGARVQHDAAAAALAAYRALAPGAPVEPYLGPDGIDFGAGAPLERTAGREPLAWPSEWYGLGFGPDHDSIDAPTALTGSSDAALATQAGHLARACADLLRHGVRAPACDVPPLAPLLPNLGVGSAVPGVALTTTRAALPVQALETAVAPGLRQDGAPLEAHDVATRDEAGPSGPVDELLAALGLAPPAALRGPSFGPASTQQATLVALDPGVTLPLALAALALPLVAWALYRRILPSRALQHPVREDLVRRVRAHPGIHESQLAREMGLRHTHVQYHLRVLSEAGVLETRKFGGLKCIFELGRHSSAEKAAAMTERGRSREVLHGVAAEPGVGQRELARRLTMSESSVKWHLDRLEQAGLVRTERARGAKRAWVQPGALAAPPADPMPAPAAVLPVPPAPL